MGEDAETALILERPGTVLDSAPRLLGRSDFAAVTPVIVPAAHASHVRRRRARTADALRIMTHPHPGLVEMPILHVGPRLELVPAH